MSATAHAMTRLAIPTGMRFAEFRRRFEAAAPAFDAQGAQDLTAVRPSGPDHARGCQCRRGGDPD
jgi:hypothetical protein